MGITGTSKGHCVNEPTNDFRSVSASEIDSKALQSQKIRWSDHWSRCIWLATQGDRGMCHGTCFGKADYKV